MGWSVSEDLLSVAEDGTIYVHTLHGELLKLITPGQVLYKLFVCMLFYWRCLTTHYFRLPVQVFSGGQTSFDLECSMFV